MPPDKSLFDLNWKELEINEEDRKWFDLSIEIDQIQQWIIRQKTRTRLEPDYTGRDGRDKSKH